MRFKNKIVVVTGGAHGIGLAIVHAFEKEGAHVCIIDKSQNPYFVGDIGDKEVLEAFVDKVLDDYGHVDILINNAKPSFKGLDTCSYEEFNEALRVGLSAPFYLTKLLMNHLGENPSIVNISSSRDQQSQPQSESYSAAKGGLHALTHAMAMSLAGKARVNSVSPGWINVNDHAYQGPDACQHPVKRVGRCEDIASTVLFLCSEEAGFITAENILVDGGMSHMMIYHEDHGWTYHED